MSNMNRVIANGPKTHTIEFGLFLSIAGVIAIALLDATGGSVLSLYTMVSDALVAVAAV